MWLTRKAEIAANLCEGSITVGQKTFCFFQFAAGNKCADSKT